MSPVQKRSIVLRGHNTSVSVEEPFWVDLKRIAAERGTTISGLVSTIGKHPVSTARMAISSI
jgi:predicted DNA-binding ribbon-helix-helix protein